MPLKIYGQGSTANFWAKALGRDSSLRKPDEFFFSMISEYLHRNGKILDAGCGTGYMVTYLSSLGYDAIGLDFSKTLIKRARSSALNNTQLQVGDLTHLPYKKNTFATCISEGVFEHFEEGPQLPLSEVKRVLKSEGHLLITVPYCNPLRKMKKIFLPRYYYLGQVDKKEFFEYAFTKKEIVKYVEEAGFKVIQVIPISPLETLKLDIVGMATLINSLLRNFAKNEDTSARKTTTATNLNITRSVILLDLFEKIVRSEIFRNLFAHMILVIAIRPIEHQQSKNYREVKLWILDKNMPV